MPFNSSLSAHPLGSKSKNYYLRGSNNLMSQQHELYLSGMLWSSGLPCCQQLKINLGIFKKECSNSYAASLLLDSMSKEHLFSQAKAVYTQ